jgi:hypothetical protein
MQENGKSNAVALESFEAASLKPALISGFKKENPQFSLRAFSILLSG